MKNTARVESFANRYVDQVIERLHLPSDYACAQVLGTSHQAIYKIRRGGAISVVTAAKIAELLDIDPIKVIAETELERATTEEDRELWKRIGRKVAVIAIAAIGAGGGPTPPSASAAAPSHAQSAEPLRIM
jgi:predicted transcriptional regulator